ncbi:NUDIX domain-containing protein [Deinococcus wulumuqiensis]|uniref:NUDIX domain-containing protein n=1 Tax=Deinococcus wulumuqiensis TaxID=980427 RepID=A0A345II14_9DEIO|nr:NUDIX domain-containing protein [Deinococcus wulumuqiensis]AXG99336.1 NUDIX domain-containing protein [Deinococcus wulumuqiensis]
MTDPAPRPRAAALVFNEGHELLLMLRRKNGKTYATLPGGGIEDGETPAGACAREVLEEVNLTVTVGKQVLELDNRHGDTHSHEHYFLCHVVSGEMRLGDGPEGIRQSAENWYQPEWVSLNRLDEVNLVPEVLRGLARQLATPSDTDSA